MVRVLEGIQAWNELLGTFFSEKDQQAVEWSIGSVYSEGPKKILAITGPPASGKSVILKLMQSIFTGLWDNRLAAIICHDGVRKPIDIKKDAFMFVAFNGKMILPATDPVVTNSVTNRLVEVHTTGNTITYNKCAMLVGRAGLEKEAIVRHCVETYTKLGPNHYDNQIQENNE